ncbi:heavy-metal-associated domain-containing protein [Alteribacillus iranensis]|uniref:Copper ion binding protein n=1 Tax=Alteribacillus iranensis TaxID=930128 RepID=A0A1I2F1Y9_9BACI|nr:heavy metal-associated domain-containing protein [Alteribacillus iranensis]SFE98520.1 copper ion binding protein [Alteribacillus iranensis]
MKTAKFQLETLTCPSCIKKIEGTLSKMDGVENVKVLFHASKVKTQFDESTVQAEELKETIRKLGYPVLSTKVS